MEASVLASNGILWKYDIQYLTVCYEFLRVNNHPLHRSLIVSLPNVGSSVIIDTCSLSLSPLVSRAGWKLSDHRPAYKDWERRISCQGKLIRTDNCYILYTVYPGDCTSYPIAARLHSVRWLLRIIQSTAAAAFSYVAIYTCIICVNIYAE